MNLQHLMYAVEIQRHGSISKASKALYVSQPYLSRIILELEKEYGITIFARSKSGIVPTQSGQLFLDMANDLLNSARHFERTFDDLRDSYRLRISSCPLSHASDSFLRMVKDLPDASLRFSYRECCSNVEVIGDVYNSRADIGLVLLNGSSRRDTMELMHLRRLDCHPLFHSGTWLIARTGHPLLKKKEICMEDVYRCNFVLYPDGAESSSGFQAIESVYNASPMNLINWNRIRQIIYVRSRAMLHNVLTRTDYLGIGMAPVLEQKTNYGLVSFPFPEELSPREEEEHENTLCMIYQKDRELSKAARSYITFLKKNYGENSDFPGAVK